MEQTATDNPVKLKHRDERISTLSVIAFVDFCIEHEGHGKELMEMAFAHWVKAKQAEEVSA